MTMGANLESLRRLYEAWEAGDWSETSLFDPHFVGVFPDPAPRAHYGLEAVSDYLRRMLDSWDDLRIAAIDYREVEGGYVVHVRRSAIGRSSGLPVEDFAIHIWTFRGGHAIRMDVFEGGTESEALEAAGPSE